MKLSYHMKQSMLLFCSILSIATGAKIHSEQEFQEVNVANWIGKTVAFHSPFHNRFMLLNDVGWVRSSPVGNQLLNGYTWERFKVVDAGSGQIALHSTHFNRFIMMTDERGMKAGRLMGEDQLPHGNGWERFKLVDAGNGRVALHSTLHNRFVWMQGDGAVWGGGTMNEDALPATGHAWERFVIVESTFTASCGNHYTANGASCKANLIGQVAAFYNPFHNRFARMNDVGIMDASITRNYLPDGWTWERFEVVDAGNGEVALFCPHWSRYIMMTDQQHVGVSALFDRFGLPRGHAWEKFTIVDALNGRIAFHSKFHNKFMMMNGNAKMIAGGIMGANQLPAIGHDWERFVAHTTTYLAVCPFFSYAVAASCKSWLIGQVVAFYNDHHQKFMQMNDAGVLVTSQQMGPDDLCENCAWEKFTVVDVGGGLVGLYNVHQKRYVKMTSAPAIVGGPVGELPGLAPVHLEEGFQVVDVGNNEIGLHNPHRNRFMMMSQTSMLPSGLYAPDALPAGHQWERLTVVYTGVARLPPIFEVQPNQRCKGMPYTKDYCNTNNCNGWEGVTQEQCQEYCEQSKTPSGCSQQQQCLAAVWTGGSYCQLYPACVEMEDDTSSVTIRKKATSFLQAELGQLGQLELHQQSERLELHQSMNNTLAIALPIALVNLSNFSGLVSQHHKPHLDVTHKFGNLEADLALMYDKVEGFYTALHSAMGADAEEVCPRHTHTRLYKCVQIAVCILQGLVPAEVPITYYASMMEQVGRFDITWENILEAFSEISNGTFQVPPHYEIPSKYQCDDFERVDGLTQAVPQTGFTQLNSSHSARQSRRSRILAVSAALETASHETLRIVTSHTSNTSARTTTQKLEELWYPLCQEMKCDHTNFLDIFFSSHGQTMALMQTGTSASHVGAEILTRVRLEREMQKLMTQRPELASFWRGDQTTSSLDKAHDYGRAGNRAVLSFVEKFVHAHGGEDRALMLIDFVEYQKFRTHSLNQWQNGTALMAEGTKTRGVWGFLKKLFSCFGNFARFYAQGYSKTITPHTAANIGLALGDSADLKNLLKKDPGPQYPNAFVSIYGSVTAGTATEVWWAGLSVSFSVSLGCSSNQADASMGISMGVIGCGVMQWNNLAVCPFGKTLFGMKCSQAHGGAFTILCCSWNLLSGENSCR